MNTKKIAFIACVNNEDEYGEALFYINRLHVPHGYEIDVIAVREAESMTSGYQAAMESSDAKYKVYIHQDTFIINPHFIEDMLKVFCSDAQIGMLGCIGCEELPLHAQAVTAWNVGLVYHNCVPSRMERRQSEDGTPIEVEALDGLLLATQYDVDWRSDLFDGWDFYDVAQCFEMRRAGYRVVVPFQKTPWCYHDNTYSNMTKYYEYCKQFVEEYQDINPFEIIECSKERKEYDSLRELSRTEMKMLVETGQKDALREVFQNSENCGYLHLREFETLAHIDQAEACAGEAYFWTKEDSFASLMRKLDTLKFALKRMEYGSDECGEAQAYIKANYSMQAIRVIYHTYSVENTEVWSKLNEM